MKTNMTPEEREGFRRRLRVRLRWIIAAPLILLLFLLFIAVGGEVVRQLWNWLLPPLFAFPRITFWQALGLLALCRILFGGFSSSGSRFRRRMEDSMTPEDRERFRRRIRERWGLGASSREAQESTREVT